MKPLPAKPIPQAPQRIALVNPTRYLGNLLLAGGLIQAYAQQCQARGQHLLIILDDSFQDLCRSAFPDLNQTDCTPRHPGAPRRPGEGRGPVLKQDVPPTQNATQTQNLPTAQILYYPRRQISNSGPISRLRLFLEFLNKIKNFKPDLAFNIEEDTTTSRLTQLSGAKFRLGCSPARHNLGYEHVLPISHADRPATQRHRWFSFLEVFQAAGLTGAYQNYINLHINQPDEALIEKLHKQGIDPATPLIAIHPSATKTYKMWPESAFAELCNLLIEKGFKPVLVGAGNQDTARCAAILELANAGAPVHPVHPVSTAPPAPRHPGEGRGPAPEQDQASPTPTLTNLCNHLSLHELAQFFLLCQGIVGNDSGPFHIAAALGLPGVVIFGPSDAGIWGPLGARSKVLQRQDLCDARCSRKACYAGYRCLREIRAELVLEELMGLMGQEQLVSALDPGLRRGDELANEGRKI